MHRSYATISLLAEAVVDAAHVDENKHQEVAALTMKMTIFCEICSCNTGYPLQCIYNTALCSYTILSIV